VSIPEFIDTVTTRHRIEEALRKTATEGNLIKIADELGVNVAYVPKNKYKRPCFGPNQVRCRHQLREGKKYNLVSVDRPRAKIVMVWLVTRAPYQSPTGDLLIDVDERYPLPPIGMGGHGRMNQPIILFGVSIECGLDGTWEQDRYLAFEDRRIACGHPDCQHSCPNCS